MKAIDSIGKLPFKLSDLRPEEGNGISGVRVKSVDIAKNTSAKAISWSGSDAKLRKLGERTELDTLVVLAVNDEH